MTATRTARPGVSETPTKTTTTKKSWLAQALRVEWLGQMAASMCWIASVMCYGITSAGDWLQLAAASSWFVANIASIVSTGDN